jgi:hypothetical protein
MQRASDGPSWRRLMVQGWSSGGGLRVVVFTQGTTTPLPPPIPGVGRPPDWTPFGRRGWQASYTTYDVAPYPLEDFMAHRWTWNGFQICYDADDSAATWKRERSITLPAWFCSLLLAVLPACSVAMFIRRSAASRAGERRGLCPRCGYDLRATPRRCPECGHEPKQGRSDS